jgi:fructose-bisphosphate aldolase class 1
MLGWAILLETSRCHMAQERTDLAISQLYLNVAIECFNKAAIEEHADGAEVFRRMGHHYISEAELYDATLQQKSAGRLALPKLWRRIGASSRAHGRSIVARRHVQ